MKKLLLTFAAIALFACPALATTWKAMSGTSPQYENSSGIPYSGAVLKAYSAGTTNVTAIATDNTGGTTATSVALNSYGFPVVSGNVIIPYISESYKLALYPTQSAADSNTGAIWTIDNIPFESTTNGFANGTVTAPSIFFSSDTNTGIYRAAADTLAITSGGVDVMRFQTIASAVNYINMAPSATGNPVTYGVAGSDTNIGIAVLSKGTGNVDISAGTGSGSVRIQQNGNTTPIFQFNYAASAVDYFTATGSAAGSPGQPSIGATGSDTNVGMAFIAKGTGQVDFRAGSGATNTLSLTTVANAVNSISLNAQATGSGPTIQPIGSDTDISLSLYAKGAGSVIFSPAGGAGLYVANVASAVNYWSMTGAATSGNISAAAAGSDSNISMNFAPKGTGNIIMPSVWANSSSATAVHVDSNGLIRKTTSSKRYKNPAGDYNRGLEYALKLHPVLYTEKSDSKIFKTVLAGFYCEDVADAGLDEFVYHGTDGKCESLHYENMAALFVNVIKELNAKNDNLEKRLEALEAK